MGFTLGMKEFIVNSNDEGTVSSSGSKLVVKGFGTFDVGKVKSIRGQRFIPGVLASMSYSIGEATTYLKTGENSAVLSIIFETRNDRYDAEYSNSMLKQGKPVTFSIVVVRNETANDLRTKLLDAIAAWDEKFTNAQLPFTAASGAGTGQIDLTMKSGLYNLSFRNKVITDTASMAKPKYEDVANLVKPVYPKVDGKYLEETVRMSLPATSDLYSIQAEQLPRLSGKYTSVEVILYDTVDGGVDDQYKIHKGLGGTKDEQSNTREHKFVVYLEDGGSAIAGADGALQKVADWADGGSKFAGNFYMPDGTVAPDVATWIA